MTHSGWSRQEEGSGGDEVLFDLKREITSIGELVEHGPLPESWFRGQSEGALPPLPSVLRAHIARPLERHSGGKYSTNGDQRLFEQFRRSGYSLFPLGASVIDCYFLAQHYGLPTRLLDWTTNPLSAVYFAVRDNFAVDGCIFELRPAYQFAGGRGTSESDPPPIYGPETEDNGAVRAVVQWVANASTSAPGYSRSSLLASIPVFPRMRQGRMAQQGSCFTLHPPPFLRAPTYRHFPPGHLDAYTIPAEAKKSMFDELRHLGTTASTLFPDLDHVVEDIRREFGLPR